MKRRRPCYPRSLRRTKHEIEEQVTRAASAESAVAPFATAPADTAAEALAAPSATEPPAPAP